MNLGRKITAAGLTASLLATPFSCSGALTQANEADGAEAGYNVLFIVTDQEHYENNVHVPLIIVHPDFEGGRTVSAVTVNLAADPDANAELILQMNDLLNKTIEQEIGVDDGMHVKMVLKALQEKAKAA